MMACHLWCPATLSNRNDLDTIGGGVKMGQNLEIIYMENQVHFFTFEQYLLDQCAMPRGSACTEQYSYVLFA